MRIDTFRRRLLLAAGGLGASGLLTGLAAPRAQARSASDYKALVCVFLYGGADSNDMVVPLDDYAAYAAVRGRGGKRQVYAVPNPVDAMLVLIQLDDFKGVDQ